MMKQLMWKDVMTVRPLVLAIGIGIAFAFMANAVFSNWTDAETIAILNAWAWILMPNLVALGAPALLVGTEEESGTLGWLRTLPIEWTNVAFSKWLVAVSSLLATWCLASAAMALGRFSFAGFTPPWVREWTSAAGISYLLTFSLLLLHTGFITSYLFRSPVAGLVAVAPLIFAVNWVMVWVIRFFPGSGSNLHRNDLISIEGTSLGIWIAFGLLVLSISWMLQHCLAWRRLTSPDLSGRARLLKESVSPTAYHPPRIFTMVRPPRWRALLWQHFRQMGWWGVALTLVPAGLMLVWTNETRGRGAAALVYDMAPSLVVLCASWLGGLAFYGDNLHRRVAFLSDRGVSAHSIWWTRMLTPTMLVGLLVGIGYYAGYSDSARTVILFAAVAFAIGQLVGQWMRRPVLTFFASPALTAMVALALAGWFSLYPSYFWLSICVVPVLLFATWRLTSRWLSGHVDAGYHWRVLGYVGLAIGVPMAVVVAIRVASTPPLDAQWRQTHLSDGAIISSTAPISISPTTFSYMGLSQAFEDASSSERRELLDEELHSTAIGDSLSIEEIIVLLDSPDEELVRQAIAVLLKWSTQIRQDLVAGNHGIAELENGAERSEQIAIQKLQSLIALTSPSEDFSPLIESIPDARLRHDSRRATLLREWNRYQQTPWQSVDGQWRSKTFLREPAAFNLSHLGYERTRTDRFVDALAKLLLQQLDSGLPEYGSGGMLQRDELYRELAGDWWRNHDYPMPICHSWTRDYELAIETLRDSMKADRQ